MGGSASAVLRPTLTASTSTGLGAGWVCPGTTSASVTSAWAASAESRHAGAVAEVLGVDEAELDEAAGGHAQSG